MKILLLDIETAPANAYVWKLFKENIPLVRLISDGYTLCWSAKWYQEEEIFFDSIHRNSKEIMLKNIWKLLDECDAVVHYNGTTFDVPTLNAEFLIAGMPPPSPYKQIDLYRTVKSQFRIISNKLDHISKLLGIGQKEHTDFELWIACMEGKPTAWKTMESYNIQDTNLLEKAYDKLKPWIKNHPNVGLYQEDREVCPRCGSKHIQKRGTYPTVASLYQRYRCVECKTWFRGTKPVVKRPTVSFTSI